jgi:hypothetical protein
MRFYSTIKHLQRTSILNLPECGQIPVIETPHSSSPDFYGWATASGGGRCLPPTCVDPDLPRQPTVQILAPCHA